MERNVEETPDPKPVLICSEKRPIESNVHRGAQGNDGRIYMRRFYAVREEKTCCKYLNYIY